MAFFFGGIFLSPHVVDGIPCICDSLFVYLRRRAIPAVIERTKDEQARVILPVEEGKKPKGDSNQKTAVQRKVKS